MTESIDRQGSAAVARLADGLTTLVSAAAGAVFAFATSLDEVVVALFVAGPAQRTLPRQMFSGLNDQISLTTTAAAAMLVVMSVLLLLAVAWLQARGRRRVQG